MTGYYEDSEKLTFDEADRIVNRFLREFDSRKTHVTCKDIISVYEIEMRHHNLIRINKALDKKLETTRESGSRTKQYKMP